VITSLNGFIDDFQTNIEGFKAEQKTSNNYLSANIKGIETRVNDL
jgi:hypothetical protein